MYQCHLHIECSHSEGSCLNVLRQQKCAQIVVVVVFPAREGGVTGRRRWSLGRGLMEEVESWGRGLMEEVEFGEGPRWSWGSGLLNKILAVFDGFLLQ